MHNELETPSRYKSGSVAMLTPPQEREGKSKGREGKGRRQAGRSG